MLDIVGIDFGYDRKKLFEGLSLHVEMGKIYGLLGKNGAGKTSLLRMMTGLLIPQAGECRIFGEVASQRRADVLEEIFFLSETIHLPAIHGEQFVRFIAPFYPHFRHERFDYYLREFEIERRQRLPHLSLGQQKKFLLAFGMASGCRLLMLDEPTNGLDIPSKGQFRRLLAEAVSERRTAIISTHQVNDVHHLIDPILILENGRIVFNATKTQIDTKLRVDIEAGIPAAGTYICTEQVPGGYAVLRAGSGAESASELNLEMLFNGVIGAPDVIADIFTEDKQEAAP